MVYAFDSLGYAKRLRAEGVKASEAEAIAEAAREYILAELVTKSDLQMAIDTQTLRLTVRLGAIMIGVMGALAVLSPLH
jgi:hypothetical protein